MTAFQTLAWNHATGSLRLLDQRRLPEDELFIECETLSAVTEAIKTLAVRGAPAIGVTAAYGVVIGIREEIKHRKILTKDSFLAIIAALAATRPTAVNLFWALDRMKKLGLNGLEKGLIQEDIYSRLLQEADLIFAEDQRDHRLLGEYGAELVPAQARILTH